MNAVVALCAPKRIAQTKAALTARGAELLATTNPYELLRFRSAYGVGVVYRNDAGRITPNREAIAALQILAEKTAGSLAPAVVRKRAGGRHRANLVNTVIERDGADCFFCGEALVPDSDGTPDGDRTTLEHLVSRTHGGPNHVANLFCAHQRCNNAASHLSAPEKIALRDRMRAEPRSAAA